MQPSKKHQKGKTADDDLDPWPTGKTAANDLDPWLTGKSAATELDPWPLKEADAAAAALTLPFRPTAAMPGLFCPKSIDAPMSSILWAGNIAGEKLGLYANSGEFGMKNPFHALIFLRAHTRTESARSSTRGARPIQRASNHEEVSEQTRSS